MRDPRLPAPTPTPRTHPRVGDTHFGPEGGTSTVMEGPGVLGGVRIRDPYGNVYWTQGWGVWSGVYTRRDPRYNPHVGDTKQYADDDGLPYDNETYTVTSVEPFQYTGGQPDGARASWESDSGLYCTWTCVEDIGGAS